MIFIKGNDVLATFFVIFWSETGKYWKALKMDSARIEHIIHIDRRYGIERSNMNAYKIQIFKFIRTPKYMS